VWKLSFQESVDDEHYHPRVDHRRDGP
jgi:hypothetical protein